MPSIFCMQHRVLHASWATSKIFFPANFLSFFGMCVYAQEAGSHKLGLQAGAAKPISFYGRVRLANHRCCACGLPNTHLLLLLHTNSLEGKKRDKTGITLWYFLWRGGKGKISVIDGQKLLQ